MVSPRDNGHINLFRAGKVLLLKNYIKHDPKLCSISATLMCSDLRCQQDKEMELSELDLA